MRGFSRIAAILTVGLVLCGCGKKSDENQQGGITMVVHGGAGTILKENMTPEREREYRDVIEAALRAGHEILVGGGTSIEAVVAAACVFEDSPLFNAGKGSVFTGQGTNEMDASIMDGSTQNAGAVAFVTTVKNPIKAALEVMSSTKHVMLVGRGAELFAAERGLEIVGPEYFFTQRRWEALLKAKEKDKQQSSGLSKGPDMSKFGTAAAVALDGDGNLAAATSTGGLTNKMHGRVGDSPIIGAGTYAKNSTCAVSSTGQGEYFMRGLLAYEVSALMEHAGMTVEAAAKEVVEQRLGLLGGRGGIIALDGRGNVAMEFNTAGMYRGYVRDDGQLHTFIYRDE